MVWHAKRAIQQRERSLSFMRLLLSLILFIHSRVLPNIMSFIKLFHDQFGQWPTQRKLAALTGCSIQMLCFVWRRYGRYLRACGITKLDLLWTFSWMKLYLSWDAMSNLWRSSKTTFERRVKDTIYSLNECMKEVSTIFPIYVVSSSFLRVD